ncbi:unnamed protein product [Closterium sp. NIES-54]
MSREVDLFNGADSEQSCPAAASIPDESGPLVALSELDSCDLISGPHSAHRQPRQARKRGDDGKLLMSWRVPEWTLPPLTTDLRLSSQEPLEQLESRTQCPGCGKSQHYFCFNCLRVGRVVGAVGAMPFESTNKSHAVPWVRQVPALPLLCFRCLPPGTRLQGGTQFNAYPLLPSFPFPPPLPLSPPSTPLPLPPHTPRLPPYSSPHQRFCHSSQTQRR